jgi:raffinose/stachyose/melibiose transport system substrate-binding protein
MKKIKMLGLGLAATVLLAACGAPAPPAAQVEQKPAEQKPAEVKPTEAPKPAANSVKIVWWHIFTQDNEKKAYQELADEFTKANPNVNIEITVLENEAFKSKLATNMQSGSPPDIFQSWGGGVLGQYAEAGLVKDLTEAIKVDGFGDTLLEGPKSLYTINGKTYGLPWKVGMVGFWYRKDLFKQAGIEDTPKTWTEFLETVKKLKAANLTPIALGGKEKWPGHFYWVYAAIRMGGKAAFDAAYTRSGKFSDPAFVEAGARLKELVDLQPFQNGFLGAGYPDHAALVANGKAAMELMGHWAYGFETSLAKDKALEDYKANIGWFPFPTMDGQKGDASDALGGGDGFAIGKNAPPEALNFVKFMLSKENQSKMAKAGIAVPPVVKGVESAVDNLLIQEIQKRAGAAKYFQLYYDQYLPPAVGNAVNDETQKLFAGTASPQQVADAIEAAAAAELK